MRNNEVTEKLRKPDKFTHRKFFIIGGIIIVILIGLVVLNFSKSPPYVPIPFLNSFDENNSDSNSIPKTITLANGDIFNDNIENQNTEFLSEEGNTTGNLGNYGKAVTVGNVSYVSTFNEGINYLWKFENGKYVKIYEVADDVNGINDLQFYKGKLYCKSAGVFGYIDLNTNKFHHIALEPGDSLPVSPRIYRDKLYYITYEGIDQFYIYESNLDGSSNRKLSTLDPGLRLNNFVAFTIKDDLIYLFVNTIINDFTQKESKIQTVSLENGAKNTLYTTNCYIDEYISYSDDWIYFLESNSTENTNKSIYKLKLDGSNPILILDGSTKNITSINSNGSQLFYQENGIIYACDLEGSDSVEVGSVQDKIGKTSNSNLKTFLLLTNNKILAEERIRNSNGIRNTYLYEANLDDFSTFHEVHLDYS